MLEQKRKIFEETLTKAYEHDKYVMFLRELLDNMKLVAPTLDQKPYNTFSSAIAHYRHIGNYVGEDHNKVALFSVCLKNDRNIENARSMQRAFIKSLLKDSDCAAALVSFYTKDDLAKWRLSLVRLDYEFSNGKLSEKLTPAKRYSYLVGEGEPCHTAQERLYPIFVEDDLDPSLDELENAFSVEAVTKDFFDQYREKYLDLKDYLDTNEDFVAESKSRGFDSEQFAKKLMGQIVFLYFIQKKGWLGVNAFPSRLIEREYKNSFYRPGRKPKELIPLVYKQASDGIYYRDTKALMALSPEDATELSTFVKGDAWGTGPKNFMRKIFEGCVDKGKNFFDDYLEPLFYTGLNQNRGDNAYFPPLHRRIPFLNGGLFEEMEGYDWRNNDFCIPNDIFSNEDVKGRDADGILDIFDRYNFTMAEDEPMEREVAIDPEMLGKVFENLLDVSDRKSKGAFYTPREIVHYMCQESLINYLCGKTQIPEDDIRKFILFGEYFRDEDIKKTLFVPGQNGNNGHYEFDKNKDMEIPSSILSFKNHVNRLQELDDLLANVKVVDLAVGSGAFPVGMMTEIVKARDTITSYMIIEMNNKQRLNYHTLRTPYLLKRATIKNSIFACDIEASATDITKLRLWLSLVIDNQIMDQEDERLGYSTKPRELPNLDCNIICGNSLMDEFEGIPLLTENAALQNESENRQQTIYDGHLGILINELIELQSKLYDEKDRIAKDSFKDQIQDIYNQIVMEQIQTDDKVVDDYYQAILKPSKPFVLWQLYFPKVFRDSGGFDIVIGNPPYVDSEEMTKSMPEEREIYARKFKCAKGNWDLYIPFWEKGFSLLNEYGNACLITPNKWLAIKYGEALRAKLFDFIYNISDYSNFYAFESADVSTVVVMANQRITDVIKVVEFDEEYNQKKNLSVKKNEIQPYDNLSLCLTNHFSTLLKIIRNEKLDVNYKISGAATVSETYEIAKIVEENLNVDPKQYFKFINTGTIEKFAVVWGKQVMTYVKKKYLYPVISHEALNLMFPKRYKQSKEEKLITTGIRYFKVFGDFTGEYCAAKSTEIITSRNGQNLKMILPILNSNVVFFFLKEAYGGIAMGGGITFSPNNLCNIPIPKISQTQQHELIELADKFSMQGFDDTDQDNLDRYIYKLYNLNQEDVEVIESFKKANKRKR